ncbi:MAG TPA: 8-amino-7-oxononanoate synthase [Desulfomonilaceae bacterium]|nr:8-amino-7-oxononanoate synthase [Desulfomonilaceae bacterium]
MSTDSMRADPWNDELHDLRRRELYRTMPRITGLPGRLVTIDGCRVLNFSSNNYLGLAGHPDVVQALADSARVYGAGSTASRLIAGNTEIHRELERFIATWKGTEAAVLFGSGYQANVGVISSLMDKSDLIVSDELNHASIIDGCRLSRGQVIIYPHRDLNRLEDALRTVGFRRKLVVTESVFSMDGDRAALREIDYLCRRWKAVLMVDEAHATGVLGDKGQGLAAELGVVPEIQMGTLGKAAGTSGAYVAGSRRLVELLTNKARSLIYTTAAPPAVVGSALAALKILSSSEGSVRRARLKDNMEHFNRLLSRIPGFSADPSHIVPVRVGDSSRTMKVSSTCLSEGVFAHGIRFPTVPEGTARLRFTLMSDHAPEDLETAVSVLERALEAKDVEPRQANEIGHCRS